MAKVRRLRAKKRAYGIKAFLLATVFLALVPVYYVFANAFKDKQYIQLSPLSLPVDTFTLENLQKAFKSLKYLEAFTNSLILVLISCLLMIAVGSLAAFAVSIVNSKPLNGFYMTSILLITIPFQVVMIPLVLLLRDLHLLDSYLGTSLVYTALSLPLVIFLYTGFMRSLPRELCEAAVVDGCGYLRTYASIYMPLMKTVTGTILILRGTYVWNDLLVSKITISVGKMTPLTPRLFAYASSQFNSWDLMFGGTLLCALPIVALFLALQKSFIKGVVTGAVKG